MSVGASRLRKSNPATITAAMKAKDAARLSALRMLKAAIMNKGVEKGRDLDDAETAELAAFTKAALRAIRAVSSPHAFNVGLNLGGAAGGSLADHLHQHVVPRWSGDANFMTVVAGTKTLPQLLGDTRDLLATAWTLAP